MTNKYEVIKTLRVVDTCVWCEHADRVDKMTMHCRKYKVEVDAFNVCSSFSDIHAQTNKLINSKGVTA